jgi:hypothetical protein
MARLEAQVRGADVSETNEGSLSMKWRILIVVIVLTALLVLVIKQAY